MSLAGTPDGGAVLRAKSWGNVSKDVDHPGDRSDTAALLVISKRDAKLPISRRVLVRLQGREHVTRH